MTWYGQGGGSSTVTAPPSIDRKSVRLRPAGNADVKATVNGFQVASISALGVRTDTLENQNGVTLVGYEAAELAGVRAIKIKSGSEVLDTTNPSWSLASLYAISPAIKVVSVSVSVRVGTVEVTTSAPPASPHVKPVLTAMEQASFDVDGDSAFALQGAGAGLYAVVAYTYEEYA